MARKPLALSPALPSELLTYVLAHQVYPTTLIICQTRSAFLASLLSSISQPIQRQPPPPAADVNENTSNPEAEVETDEFLPPEPPRHPLLIPTLHQIATSRNINLVFIPTVTHLRAYLSVFPSPKPKDEDGKHPEPQFDKPGKQTPLLVVYGLADLHRDTSEWSAQGVGNSIAGLVEAGWRSERAVVVLEERKEDEYTTVVEDGEEGNEQAERKPRWKVWEERVPMLNGSVRRAGFESEESAWSGRTIEVGRIFARWFRFRRGDWDMED